MRHQRKKVVGFNIVEVIIIIIISGLTSAIATGIITASNNRTSAGITYSELLQDEGIKNFLDVYADVVNGYYQNVDKNKAIDSALSGMMEYLGDKYTTYLNDNQTDNLNDLLNGTYKGIGIMVSKGSNEDTSNVGAVIEKVFEDSPAKSAGFQVGDEIIKIKDNDVRGKELADITGIIKENSGKIDITVLRDNMEKVITVNVSVINKPAVDYEIKYTNGRKVGYLYLDTFSSTAATQVKNALKKMESENIEGLIIDLRNNGGGYLTAAVDIASMFLEKNTVIFNLESKEEKEVFKDETDEKRNYNIVLLVNGGTASASEVLTSALKDSYGVKLVGKKTYGKGKVQQTKTLTDGTMVKYTTATWTRSNGECIDGIGIGVDYEVSIDINEDGTYTDTQLNKALEVIFD